MTKTKRESRAEAAGRMSALPAGAFSYMDLAASVKGAGGYGYASADAFRDALIDLLTDDEPSESNLAHHFATDEDFRVSVCEQAFARLSDSPEHPWEVAPWLEAGHEGDCGHSADMSQKGGDCVRSGSENVRETPDFTESPKKSPERGRECAPDDTRECQPMRDLMDECAEFERIVDRLTAERDERARAADAAGKRARELENELANMTGSRDHWRRVASKHAGEIQKLKAEVIQRAQDCGECSTAMPEGVEWPRFEDGACVGFGDGFVGCDGEPHELACVKFLDDGYWMMEDKRVSLGCGFWPYGETFKRPPLLASDGEPIEVGQQLVGEDGEWWLVERIDHSNAKYPVIGEHGGKTRALKPKWLSHELPDSWERIASDLRAKMFTKGMLNIEAELFAKRIEKLAKEGA